MVGAEAGPDSGAGTVVESSKGCGIVDEPVSPMAAESVLKHGTGLKTVLSQLTVI